MSLHNEIKKIQEQLNLHLSEVINTTNLKEGGVVGKIEVDGARISRKEVVLDKVILRGVEVRRGGDDEWEVDGFKGLFGIDKNRP